MKIQQTKSKKCFFIVFLSFPLLTTSIHHTTKKGVRHSQRGSASMKEKITMEFLTSLYEAQSDSSFPGTCSLNGTKPSSVPLSFPLYITAKKEYGSYVFSLIKQITFFRFRLNHFFPSIVYAYICTCVCVK